MAEYRLGVVEMRFANIIWDHAPLSSGELTKLCEAKLNWKRTTTYTVLKRLCDRGIFENDRGTVRARILREDFLALQSSEVVETSFGGSLSAFVAAFMRKKTVSNEELGELERLLAEQRGG